MIVSPDMFPMFTSRSEDFSMFYCLMDREFAETTLYGVPNALYDCLFLQTVVDGGDDLKLWTGLLDHAYREYAGFQGQEKIIENILHNIYLVLFNLWQQQHGSMRVERELQRPEQLCMKFYNLVLDHFTECRAMKFYADRLYITPQLSCNNREASVQGIAEGGHRPSCSSRDKIYDSAYHPDSRTNGHPPAFPRHLLYVPVFPKAHRHEHFGVPQVMQFCDRRVAGGQSAEKGRAIAVQMTVYTRCGGQL